MTTVYYCNKCFDIQQHYRNKTSIILFLDRMELMENDNDEDINNIDFLFLIDNDDDIDIIDENINEISLNTTDE